MPTFRQLTNYADATPGATDRLLFETSGNLPRGVAPEDLPFVVSSVHGRTGAVVGDEGDYDGVGANEDAVAGAKTLAAAELNRLQRYTGTGDTWTFDSAGMPGFVPIINKGSGAITLASGTATIEGAASIPADKAACAIYYGTGANVRIVVEA